MKLTRSLFIFTIVSCLSANPVAVIAKVSNSENSSASAAKTEPTLIANPFGIFQDAIRAVDQVGETVDRHNRRQEDARQRQELEEARRRATEQERWEAERRRQYFESLSPQEQKAYMDEQRQLQVQREAAANLFMLGVMEALMSEPEASPDDICEVYGFGGMVAYTTTRDRITDFSNVRCRPR